MLFRRRKRRHQPTFQGDRLGGGAHACGGAENTVTVAREAAKAAADEPCSQKGHPQRRMESGEDRTLDSRRPEQEAGGLKPRLPRRIQVDQPSEASLPPLVPSLVLSQKGRITSAGSEEATTLHAHRQDEEGSVPLEAGSRFSGDYDRVQGVIRRRPTATSHT